MGSIRGGGDGNAASVFWVVGGFGVFLGGGVWVGVRVLWAGGVSGGVSAVAGMVGGADFGGGDAVLSGECVVDDFCGGGGWEVGVAADCAGWDGGDGGERGGADDGADTVAVVPGLFVDG